jgi:hypothetical protein
MGTLSWFSLVLIKNFVVQKKKLNCVWLLRILYTVCIMFNKIILFYHVIVTNILQ